MVAGGMVVVGFVILNVVLKDVGETLSIDIKPAVAGMSAVAVIYSLLGFRVVAKKAKLFAGFISFVLFTVATLFLIIDTGGFESQFLGLWVVVAVLAGMFGWKTLLLLWGATNTYYLLLMLQVIDAEIDLQRTVLYLIATQLPFLMSFFIWNQQAVEGRPKKKASPTSFTSDDLSSDVLINSIAEGVVVVDSKNVVQVFNTSAERLVGWKGDEAIGLDFRSVFNLTDQKDQQLTPDNDPFLRVLATGESVVDNDTVLHSRNDKRLEISLVVSPIRGGDGVVGAVVGVFRDVSTERTQERQRAEFISTASHEMRTPVAAIEGYLALAMNEQVSKIDSRARDYLGKAHASTQHLGKLFQDLLTAAKSEDGRLAIHKQVVDLVALLSEIADSAKFTAEKKGLLLETNFRPSDTRAGSTTITPLYYVHADPDRLREVLTNLIDNAVKYTDEGKITLKLNQNENNIVVGVQDTGPGIPQEDIPHLFQKFYRVDSTATRQVGGTGLGLFISRKIVELNNGRIWVESDLTKGSTFFVSLPLLDKNKAEELMKEEASSKTPLSDVTTSPQL